MAEKVMEGIWWIQGQDRFLPDAHMYVIGQPGGQDFTLVDAGLMEQGSYKLDQIQKCGVSLNDVSRIIMTHTHLDHIGCLPELIKALPDAEVWVHRYEAEYLETGDGQIVFGNRMFESMVRAQHQIPEDYFRLTVHRKLEEGDGLELGGIPFSVVHIPGHSGGSIGLLNDEHKLFVAGDTIYADGAIGRYDLHSADAGQLKASLERIAQLGVDILLPGHNRIVRGGAQPMIHDTVRTWASML